MVPSLHMPAHPADCFVGAGGRHREKHSLMVDGRDETKSFRPPFAKKMTKSIKHST
jgi:hypothetical protein